MMMMGALGRVDAARGTRMSASNTLVCSLWNSQLWPVSESLIYDGNISR